MSDYSSSYRLKVAMVGPKSSQWTQKQQQTLRFMIHKNLEGLNKINFTVIPVGDGKVEILDFTGKKVYYPFTVISGHCPVGHEKYWCYDLERFVDSVDVNGLPNSMLPPRYSGCGYQYSDLVYDNGGVDTWVEIEADELKINKQIFAPKHVGWNDSFKCPICSTEFAKPSDVTRHGKEQHFKNAFQLPVITLKGFRTRNIEIAKEAQVVICYVPKKDVSKFDTSKGVGQHNAKEHYCFHCREWGHPTNGGCWVKKYAMQLGKETHLALIE
jgi:hypothetical protein